MRHRILRAMDSHIADSLDRIEAHIDDRPIKVAAWGVAGMAVMGSVAAGLGAVAAGASAYVAVRMAVKVTRDAQAERQEKARRYAQGAAPSVGPGSLRSLPEDLVPETADQTQQPAPQASAGGPVGG